MKAKHILSILFAIVLSVRCSAQISVSLLQNGFTSFSKHDLWNILVVNSSNGNQQATVVIRLSTTKGIPIVEVRTPGFTLAPGVNSVFTELEQLSNYQYSESPVAVEFRESGVLPGGNYSICINVMAGKEASPKAEGCLELGVVSMVPFFLIYPFDNDTIPSLQPVLQWIPYVSSSLNINYQVTVAEMHAEQSKEEAITNNFLLVKQGMLPDPSLAYPLTSPPLEQGKTYAWQAKAISNGIVLATSEVWKFICDSHHVELPQEDCYRLLRAGENASQYLFTDKIKFAFENRSNQPNLKYTIRNMVNGKKVNCAVVIPLKPGLNKIDLDIADCKIQSSKPYLLEIIDGYSQTYSLRFATK